MRTLTGSMLPPCLLAPGRSVFEPGGGGELGERGFVFVLLKAPSHLFTWDLREGDIQGEIAAQVRVISQMFDKDRETEQPL